MPNDFYIQVPPVTTQHHQSFPRHQDQDHHPADFQDDLDLITGYQQQQLLPPSNNTTTASTIVIQRSSATSRRTTQEVTLHTDTDPDIDRIINMADEEPTQFDEAQGAAGGLGAPTPLAQIEGNGIHARDIKAIVEAGYNTVEAVAYT